jgi:hypothetical protein
VAYLWPLGANWTQASSPSWSPESWLSLPGK